MTDPTSTTYIRFLANARPALLAGDYRITVTQSAPAFPTAATTSPAALTQSQDVTIAAPRFALDPALIHSVYPPAGANGLYDNVLPHVVLTDSTLPWERVCLNTTSAPWLAVILLRAGEIDSTAKDLRRAWVVTEPNLPAGVLRAQLAAESTDAPPPDGRFLVLPGLLLMATLPDARSLPLSAHVRERIAAAALPAPTGHPAKSTRLSVVVGARLPAAGQKMRAFLISIENAGNLPLLQTMLTNAPNAVSDQAMAAQFGFRILHDWAFACGAERADFAAMVRALDRDRLRLPNRPPHDSPALRPYLDTGRIPLGRLTRTGDTVVQWYSGPLIPLLQRAEVSGGLTDAGRQVAQSLGHAMMAASGPVARDLMHWKRALARAAMARPAHPLATPPALPPCPPSIVAWLAQARSLQSLPFTHLVPDPRMLPPDAIRLCALDVAWMNDFLAGAWRVGGMGHPPALPPDWVMSGPVTGILLRSAVVTQFPHMRIEANDTSGSPLLPFTGPDDPAVPGSAIRSLGPGLALALFRGRVARLRLHLTPEALHYGLSRNGQTNPALFTPKGVSLASGQTNAAFFDAALGKLNLARLQAVMGRGDPADFARAMVEGVEQVIITVDQAGIGGR
jgi:hypothetical protein